MKFLIIRSFKDYHVRFVNTILFCVCVKASIYKMVKIIKSLICSASLICFNVTWNGKIKLYYVHAFLKRRISMLYASL